MARERLVTFGLVVVGLGLAAFVGSAVLGWTGRGAEPAPIEADAHEGARLLDAVGPQIRVEVLNGSGRQGLARRAMSVLREQGFDVVFIGNAPGPQRDSTEVIDRVGRSDDARRVARALGVGSVASSPDPALYLEVTVVLGADWPPAEGGAGGATR